jgi:hypothetical protein
LAPFINVRALGRGSRPTRTSAKGQGMGKAVARRAYGGVAVGWPAQDGLARPVSMRRVVRTDWVRTSVQKLWDRRSRWCSGSRVRSGWGGGPAWPCPRRRAWVRAGMVAISSGSVPTRFSSIFQTKVGRVINSKVVDLLILYHFHKRCMAYFSTIFAQIGCQDAEILGSSE